MCEMEHEAAHCFVLLSLFFQVTRGSMQITRQRQRAARMWLLAVGEGKVKIHVTC